MPAPRELRNEMSPDVAGRAGDEDVHATLYASASAMDFCNASEMGQMGRMGQMGQMGHPPIRLIVFLPTRQSHNPRRDSSSLPRRCRARGRGESR
jgi:hypothetical protein